MRVFEGSTTGAPIKLAYLGFLETYKDDLKYRCLTITTEHNDDEIFQFEFNSLGM